MTIKLELTVDQTNLVLQGLAKLPFETVNSLISQIQSSGQAQLQEQGSPQNGVGTDARGGANPQDPPPATD